MRQKNRCRGVSSLLLPLALLTAVLCPPAQAQAPLWTYQAGLEIKWQQVTSLGTLLLGTDDAITCVDPETGKALWKRDDLKKVPDFSVNEVAGTPLLLVADNEGTFSAKTQLHAVEILSGKDVWQTERLKGSAIGVYPVYEKNMVLLLTTPNAGANKSEPDMIALDLVSGEVRWEAKFPNKVDLHAVEGAGKWSTKYDLSGQAPPVIDGDSIYFTFAGLHRFNLDTGKVDWAMTYDVTEGRLKRANSPALVAGDMVYTSAKGQLRAHDKATGQIKWTSKDFGGAVAEMVSKGDVLYGRMGGQFFDYQKREWSLEKPLGVVAVNKNTGLPIWIYDKAKDGITNMVLLDDQNTLLISDLKNLIGLDTTGEGKIKENFRVELEFKNQIGGGAKAARAGMKFARGGLLGMAKGSNDEDPPVAMSVRPNGTVVVRATQHMLAFDPKTRQIPWSVEYQAPGVSGWKKIVMGAITAAMYSYNYSQAANTQFGTSANTQANNNKNAVMKDYQDLYFKRYNATQSTGQSVYILTDIEEGKDKGPGIVGVSMDSGEADRQAFFGNKQPEYLVDDVTGRIFLQTKDSKGVMALAVK